MRVITHGGDNGLPIKSWNQDHIMEINICQLSHESNNTCSNAARRKKSSVKKHEKNSKPIPL